MARKNFAAAVRASIETAKRRAIIEHARASPNVTISNLLKLGDGLGDIAGSLTIQELADQRAHPRQVAAKSRPTGPPMRVADTDLPEGGSRVARTSNSS